MFEFDREEHSSRTYHAARSYILDNPLDPFGEGLAKQLINEAASTQYKIMGIGLLVLSNALIKNPYQVDQARNILKK